MSSFSVQSRNHEQRRKNQDSKNKKETATERIPSRVAQLYYKHGLFLSSYPTCAISIAIMFTMFCCYPLLNIPLPGTIPTKLVFPYESSEKILPRNTNLSSFFTLAPSTFNLYNMSIEPLTFPWARIDPYIYVQQIIFRTSVAPWNDKLQLTDAFRGPLHESFKLLEVVTNHEDEHQNTLSRLCLHVENVKRPTQRSVFPEYNCLTLSPANFWQQNPHEFNKDPSLLNTIFHYHNFQKSKVSTAEMLFGMPLKDTGLKRYPMRVRQRTIQFSLTLILKDYNPDFIKSLKEKLTKMYPLHQNESEAVHKKTLMYIYYPSEFNLLEFGPLCLIMSLGFCFFFGLTISTQSKGVYPYLVLLVGLENILVLTKAVLSTDETLDVKIRLAQGLSKEGWSTTKNLLTEITILTVGLATFVPVIQEFCIFAIVGLIADFFLQMLFFSTILGLDIKRVEYSVEVKHFPKMLTNNLYTTSSRAKALSGFYRSRSHPKLSSMDPLQKGIENDKKKIPKRLRVVNFWARTRFFQRGFMIWMVLWISNIIYHSGLIEKIFIIDTSNLNNGTSGPGRYSFGGRNDPNLEKYEFPRNFFENKIGSFNAIGDENNNITEQLNKLRHPEYDMNFRISNFHWSTILKQYNISMNGRYVTVLPTIRLSHAVSPEIALHLRNPDEEPPKHFQWKALAVALDPLDFNDADLQDIPLYNVGSVPLYPKTPMEIVLTTILVIVSIIVFSYSLIVIYRCVCTRNYAEWRSSWNESEMPPEQSQDHILDAVPVQVNGHQSQIECVVTDGQLIGSSCLQGQLKIWDANNGELITQIDRQSFFETQYIGVRPSSGLCHAPSDSCGSLSGSPPTKSNEYEIISNINQSQFPSNYQQIQGSGQFNHHHHHNQNHPQRKSLDINDLLYKQLKPLPGNDLTNRKTKNAISHGFTYLLKSNNVSNNSALIPMNKMPNLIQRSHSLKNTEEGVDAIMLRERQQHRQGNFSASPIWCLDFQDNLIVIGCADGRLEFWEGMSGNFKCLFEPEMITNNIGVTNIRLVGDKVVAVRLSGRIDFLRLETYTQGRQIDWGFTSTMRRSHTRTSSAGSVTQMGFNQSQSIKEELRCILEGHNLGHQQPVTCIDVVGCTLLTGSQDHTIKVFRMETCSLLYTLHGHCGPITSLFIDQYQSGTAGSGSQDGLLCVWDIITGACVFKIDAHEDSIVSLACSPSYIISLGLDERLRVWERFQGHLLNTMNVIHPYSSLLMLTPSLLVTARPGSLLVWDVRSGEPVREVKLDCVNNRFCPKTLLSACGSVVCDFGSQLRIVKFPLVAIDKCE
uniref:Sterol regulatory element-binding protein cleavage-activating protein n=1 Tax=Culicoides sonorensis TaxID=179676 RepID=A0A336MGS4_CULSO